MSHVVYVISSLDVLFLVIDVFQLSLAPHFGCAKHRYSQISHNPTLDSCMCFCVYVHVSASVLPARAQASSSTSFWKHPLFSFAIIQLIATSPSPLLNVTICQPSPFVFSLPLPLILPFLSFLPPLSLLPFPAHPIWSLTPHSCSSFNEDLSPSHARTYTRCSNTSHTKLPWMCLLCAACMHERLRQSLEHDVHANECVYFSASHMMLGRALRT